MSARQLGRRGEGWQGAAVQREDARLQRGGAQACMAERPGFLPGRVQPLRFDLMASRSV